MKESFKNVKRRLHKIVFVIVTTVIFASSSCVVCSAEGESSEAVESRIEDTLEDFSLIIPENMKDLSDMDGAVDAMSPRRILGGVIDAIRGRGGEIVELILTLLGIAILTSLVGVADGEIFSFASRAVGIVSAALLFDRLIFLVVGVTESLSQISDFFGAVLPITVAVNSLGVTPGTMTAQAMGMGLTLSLYSYLAREVVGPVVSLTFVLSAASGIDPLLGKLSRIVKNLFVSVVGILSVLVGASFSLQSAICAAVDSTVVRGARYAITSSIPIVGGAVSATLGVALGGVSYARSVVGAGAIAALLSMILSPLAILLIYRLCLKVGAFLSSLCSASLCEGVLSSFISALDALIALYALTSVVYIVELAAFLKGGVSGV